MKKLLLVFGLAFGLAFPAHAVLQTTRVGNVAYSILATDTNIITTTAFSASRTWTLPFAAASCIGQTCSPPANALQIIDVAGALTGTNTLVIAPQSGDTINGNAANLIISAAGARVILIPTSGNNWQAVVNGDYREATVAVGSAVSLTTATAADITTISLSQGVWSCSAAAGRTLAASTSVTQLKTSISATTATSGTITAGTMTVLATAANVMAVPVTHLIGPIRLSLTATTSYFLVAEDVFSVSTNAGYGQLRCWRN